MDTECRRIINPSIPEFKDCFYFEGKGKNDAKLCYKLIEEINEKNDKTAKIGLYKTCHHAGAEGYGDYDCCWYVGFVNDKDEIRYIIRFEIGGKSGITILFQSAKNVPKEALKYEEKVIAKYHKWLPVLYNQYEVKNLVEMIVTYLRNVQNDWEDVKKHCYKDNILDTINAEC